MASLSRKPLEHQRRVLHRPLTSLVIHYSFPSLVLFGKAYIYAHLTQPKLRWLTWWNPLCILSVSPGIDDGFVFLFLAVMMAKEKPPITVVGDVGGRIAIIVVRLLKHHPPTHTYTFLAYTLLSKTICTMHKICSWSAVFLESDSWPRFCQMLFRHLRGRIHFCLPNCISDFKVKVDWRDNYVRFQAQATIYSMQHQDINLFTCCGTWSLYRIARGTEAQADILTYLTLILHKDFTF